MLDDNCVLQASRSLVPTVVQYVLIIAQLKRRVRDGVMHVFTWPSDSIVLAESMLRRGAGPSSVEARLRRSVASRVGAPQAVLRVPRDVTDRVLRRVS